MGKERDKLIRRQGGVPVSDQNVTDEELQARYVRYYAHKGRLPPKIEAIRRKRGVSHGADGQRDG